MRSEMCVCMCVHACVWAGQGCASVRLTPGETTRDGESKSETWGEAESRGLKRSEGWDEGKIYTVEGDIWWTGSGWVPKNTYLSVVPWGFLMSCSGGECGSELRADVERVWIYAQSCVTTLISTLNDGTHLSLNLHVGAQTETALLAFHIWSSVAKSDLWFWLSVRLHKPSNNLCVCVCVWCVYTLAQSSQLNNTKQKSWG